MSGIKETIKEALGLGPKVRYGIVALGDISQRCFMPAVARTGNSEITALITSDPEKIKDLAKEYKVDPKHCYKYEEFDKFLQDKAADAIYLATPNWRHAEFAVPALKAGVHVLLEKPMDVTVAKCEEIIAATKVSNAKLMIAYRLHFEPATVEVVEKVRSGELGNVTMFTSSFSQLLDPENHRAKNGWQGGPVFDVGTYPLNAVRNIFGDEPIEVYAVGIRHPESGLPMDFDHTVAVTLTFPNNRIAQFIVSYYADIVNEYTILGSKGSIHVSPAFMYDCPLEFNPICVEQKKKHEKFKGTDQFAGECKYFSDCILKNIEPEPNGEEGLADVRVLEAVIRSLETKTAQKLDPFSRKKRKIDHNQVITIAHHKEPSPVSLTNAKPPVQQ